MLRRAPEHNYDLVNFDLLLLLHAHTLGSLLDGGFTRPTIQRLKRRMKREGCGGIIHKPQRIGVAHFFAEAAIDDYFEKIIRDGFMQSHGFYDIFRSDAWYVASPECKAASAAAKEARELIVRQARLRDPEEWCDIAIDHAVPSFENMVEHFRGSADYRPVRQTYGFALADRILHDRQVCSHISQLLRWLAPQGRGRSQRYVKRVNWLQYVMRAVVARDRGKCAYCHVDIAMELLARPNIDHIVPLSCGGCNDIVNLQLCCAKCNGDKRDGMWEADPSIPLYHGSPYTIEIAD